MPSEAKVLLRTRRGSDPSPMRWGKTERCAEGLPPPQPLCAVDVSRRVLSGAVGASRNEEVEEIEEFIADVERGSWRLRDARAVVSGRR
jgi:hypothetical protein